MAVTLRCPNSSCGHTAIVADFFRGRSVRCAKCNQTFDAPAHDDTPAGLARFEVRGPIGSGAFGDVFRAFDTQLQREVALKVPRAGILDNPRQVERFLREGRAAAALNHPNIVPVYDAGQDGDTYYLAVAFIEGHTLAQEIDATRFSPRRAASVVRSLAEALAYAHEQGIVHRDVKPGNILLDGDGEPHLTDFGIAYRKELAEKLTSEGSVLGTPAYMAPEQAVGKWGEVKPAVDQYALGVILYELLTGDTPFHGPAQAVLFQLMHEEPVPPRRKDPRIPRDLETICLKAMARIPEKRYPSCQELADDLRRWLDGEPIRGRRISRAGRLLRWVRREPKLVGLALLIVTGLVLVGLVAAERAAELARTQQHTEKLLELARLKAVQAEERAAEARRKAAEADRDAQEAVKAHAEARHRRQEARKDQEEQEKQTAPLEQAVRKARQQAAQRREALYRTRLDLVRKLLDHGERARARAVLQLEIPQPGEDDLRKADWWALMARAGG